MSKFTSLVQRAPKRLTAAVAMVAAAIIIPAAVFAWGPNRPTYTVAHPADHITFNSITDNPHVGDERNFVGIREKGSNANWSDNMTVQKGKEYTVRMYVHNNAAANLKLVAQNVTAEFNLPTTIGKSIQVNGFLRASNATPTEVYDHATFTGSEDFNLNYVEGSLRYENNVFGTPGVALPETIFTQTGAKLGYSKLDGKIPGCFQYDGAVTFTVKPQFAPDNKFTMKKFVSKHGENKWVDTYAAQPGEVVDYGISYQNTGDTQHDNVMVRDMLPNGVSYVSGSSHLKNGKNPTNPSIVDGVTGNGVNIGSYAKNANAFVTFSAKVAENDQLPKCGPNTLVNKARVTAHGGYIEDTADVTVNKECQPEVKYTCDALAVKRLTRTEFNFTTTYTVENATFKKVTYVIRDAKGNEVDRIDSTDATLKYKQTKVGKYSVQAIVTVTVDGQDKTVSSDKCKQEFEVPKTPEYCPIPGKEYLPKDSKDCKTPPELPHTGASESIVAIVGLGALIASIVYYVASRRALNQ